MNGERLKECLAELRQSQEWFAAKMGRSPRTGRRWAADEVPIPSQASEWLERRVVVMRIAEAVADAADPPPVLDQRGGADD